MTAGWGLAAEAARWRRRGQQAVRDVSFTAPPGSLVALLGAAGNGKTALLRLLAGEIRPQSGAVRLGGEPARSMRQAIGYLAQDAVPLPRLSLRDNVALGLGGAGGRAGRRRLAEAALELAAVPGPERRAAVVPAAERQRAGWARAAASGPALLLLDDPLSAHAAGERTAALWTLRDLHRTLGATTVIATRAGEEALALADLVLVIAGGRVAQAGEPGVLYERPESVAVAALTGEVSLLPGRVLDIDDDIARLRLDCGPVVSGAAAPGLLPHAPAVLCLRPERVAVAPVAAAEFGEDALDATVSGALPVGERVRLRLLLGTGATLEAARPVAAGLRGLAPGSRVAVAWQPAQAHVFATT